MDHHYQNLLDYVNDQILAGKQPAEIRQELLAAGWDAHYVDKALSGQAAAHTHDTHGQPVSHRQTQHGAAGHPAAPDDAGIQTATQPERYKVFAAIADAVSAAKANFKTILLSGIVTLVLFMALAIGYTVAVYSTFAFASLGSAGYLTTAATAVGSIGAFIVTLLVTAALSIVIQTLSTNLMALAFMDGAERNRRSFGEIFGTGGRRIVRVFGSYICVVLVAIAPYIALGAIGLAVILSSNDPYSGNADLNILLIIASFGAVAWSIVALLRYALAPFVALFEPEIPVAKTLARSRQLLVHGGQWFLFKLVLLFIILGIIVSLAPGLFVASGEGSSQITVTVIDTILNVTLGALAIGTLTMLYRNRVAVRTLPPQQ